MRKKWIKWFFAPLAVSAVALTSCTMSNPDGTPKEDPFETYNRTVFAFNMDVDHMILRPTAEAYAHVVPPPLQKGVTNVYKNIAEWMTLPNDLLQGHPKYMFLDFWRFVINTTMGVGGLFDVATRLGMPKHIETFGLTFAKWRGGKNSPYFMLPILGPTTVQNGIGFIPDYFASPFPYFTNATFQYAALGLFIVKKRAALLPANKLVDTAFDPYVFVRSAYMQNQQHLIDQNQHLDLAKQSQDDKENYLGE
ncbi:MAG: hypothetical protein ACD_29C00175G0003 [uncultured bacterium]|nr:MAG: hypothetical protein ACD_29C00175G0003 [uncultured bacterium]